MLLDRENLTRQYLDRYLKEHTLFPENILETTSMDLLIDFARIGLGIAGAVSYTHLDVYKRQGIRGMKLEAMQTRPLGSLPRK